MAMFVRIHPKDPRTGHLVERYVYRGFKFEVAKGWYRVPNNLAEELRDCVQDVNAPVPISVFQVATEDEAKKLEQLDYERANPEKKISEAISGAQSVPASRLSEKGGFEEEVFDLEEDEGEEELAPEDTPKPVSDEENPFGS